MQGAGTEEKLISSAKQVASSTAQLLVACKVKADPESEATHRLQVRIELISAHLKATLAYHRCLLCASSFFLRFLRSFVFGQRGAA